MKKLFVIISAITLLASCTTNRSTFVDIEDGKMFSLNSGHFDRYLTTGDTIVYTTTLSSAYLGTRNGFHGIYNGKAIPKDTDWDHWSSIDSSYSYHSITYHLAIKID